MKIKHVKRLKSIEYGYAEYGYIPLSQYREYYHLKSLRKIIKLKNINRKLSDRRIEILDKAKYYHDSQLRVMYIDHILELQKLSEQIGRNSNKIQRLRSSYAKFSDKWLERKCKKRGCSVK